MADVAERVAADTTVFNQEACLASRFVFIEGERDQVEGFCAALAAPARRRPGLRVGRGARRCRPSIRDEIEVMEPWARSRSGAATTVAAW